MWCFYGFIVLGVARGGFTAIHKLDDSLILPQEGPGSYCPKDHFRCANGQCIASALRCDERTQCDDGSDELDCRVDSPTCGPNQFQCAITKTCLTMGWVCDAESDCGISPEEGEDTSDEDPARCHKSFTCPWNEAACGDGLECLPLVKFCDGVHDCPDNSDEWTYCHDNGSLCDKLQCSYGCRPTPNGAQCYCPKGQRPEGTKCVDADECLIDGSCAQLCKNTEGSFECSCVSGYTKNGTDCLAINSPESESASLIYSTRSDIVRITLDGQIWPGNSSISLINNNALEFIHRNQTICYVHNNLTKSAFMCANINDMNQRWEISPVSSLVEVASIQQMAWDWIGANWYFADEQRELIIVCNSDLKWCNLIIDYDLSKPKSIALDPTSGYLFFTKWGNTDPALERCKMDGSERKIIVASHRIVYPYGVTIDYPNKFVYWLDTYLDYVERVDYEGNRRKTVIKGTKAQNLYGVTTFENTLFASSWKTHTIIELNKHREEHRTIMTNISRPFNVFVYHKQRQSDVAHPCKGAHGCQHMCISMWNKQIAEAKCLCASGYRLNNGKKCEIVIPPKFLLISQHSPHSINGFDLSNMYETIVPITKIGLPGAVSFDYHSGNMFYSDLNSLTIEMAPVKDTANTTTLVSNVRCLGLAFDWISRVLYFTTSRRDTISAVLLKNTTIVRTIIQNDISPNSIAVDPIRGLMYWTQFRDKTPGRIESANMNGKNRRVLVSDDLDSPTSLTIDYKAQRLYWSENTLKIVKHISLLGDDKQVLIANIGRITYPISIAVDQTGLLHVIQKRSLLTYSNTTGVRYVHNSTKGGVSHDVKLYEPDAQTIADNVCSKLNCPQLCLPTPTKGECACADGLQYQNGTCIKIPNYRTPSVCPQSFFQCTIKRHCIPSSYLCDGVDNCGDGSDESTAPGGACENISCGDNQLKCDNTTCIAQHWICDGERDCQDGTDEDPKRCQCTPTQIRCKHSGRCISVAWKCDNVHDCGPGDQTDEENCRIETCATDEFTCKNNQCIPYSYYCDSVHDCDDGSDEEDCVTCNTTTHIVCLSLNKCLPIENKCNKVPDCPDGSDERDCEKPAQCESTEFTCHNGECIPKMFVCDTDVDCRDNSDELNCNSNRSRTNQTIACQHPNFSCDNGTMCLTPAHICDGKAQCLDKSDESPLCAKGPPIAACEYPHRLCDNGTKCITTDQMCDQLADCADGSDEGMRCDERLCDHTYTCSHNCHNTPEGLICSCPPHLYLQGDKTNCYDTHPCEGWGVCSQLCVPRGSRYKCTCLPGYQLQKDGFTCKSTDSSPPYAVFSNRHELRGIHIHTLGLKSFITNLKNTITLDFHHTKDSDMVFWTDIVDDKIYRGTLVGGFIGNIEVVVQAGLTRAEGLAVDWIGENLYWIESNLDQIEVAKLNGRFRRTLVAGDMESPRAIAVDPRDGLLFWTDWEKSLPRIERCSLAGLDRTIVVRIDETGKGGWPNGLTLDYDSRRIYWIDAKSDSIHTTKYDGSDAREVMSNHELLSHPFAITLFENYVYWTDWRTNGVVRANKWNGGDVKVVQKTVTQPFDIKVMHPSRHPTDGINPCGQNNGGCSHLCLLHLNHTYRCDCPHVMRLSKDNKKCEDNEKILLIAKNSEIRGVDILQPYYHTIPTISTPVLSPAQLEYTSKNAKIYWVDVQVNEIKRSGLTSGPVDILSDTTSTHASGISIDWISNLMFVGSDKGIAVTNLDGEYHTVILDNVTVLAIAANPPRGELYFISSQNTTANLEVCKMNGLERKVLVKDLKTAAKSLVVDSDSNKLFWISGFQVYSANIDGSNVQNFINSSHTINAVTIYKDSIYYADDTDLSIHVADKLTGANDTILRNGTGGVFALRIYDPALQTGSHPCQNNKAGCKHLCLPISEKKFQCQCATGYDKNPKNQFDCIGKAEFLFHSLNWELQGLSLDGNNKTKVLGPISRVLSASSIDFDAEDDTLFWADGDHGTITRIKRDGTNRTLILEQMEVDNAPMDWLTGLAVDWIGKNIFWCDSKRGVIEVASLDGTKHHVLLSNEIGKATTLAVDPIKGYLVWASGSKIEIATMDGQNRKILIETAGFFVSDVTLDSRNEFVYFCESTHDFIGRVKYDGSRNDVLLNTSVENPIALNIYEDFIYWMDSDKQGSIKVAQISNMANFTVLLENLEDSVKDLTVFSKKKQGGTNPCALNNGGCEQLCLFNSTHPVCVCSHGRLSANGKNCEAFESFIMYSRVVSIESIQMLNDKNLQNSPHPSIKNNSLLKNAIGMAFSYKHQRLFYSDIQKGSINTVFYNGSDHKVIVERQGSIEGLAYEQVHHALYWTCNNEPTINRVNLTKFMTNASHVETIVRLRMQDKPRGIAIDSCGSQLFWTNWNSHHPSVDRVALSGYGRESIIKTEIRMPNGITLDHKAQKLYWADARLDKIERCEYDGSNRVVLAKVTPQHPFALAVYGDYIYWTDWMLHAVLRADKYTGQYVLLLRREFSRPMGIVAVANDTEDCFSNPCKIRNGGCEDKCTLSAAGIVECSCREGHVLSADNRCIAANAQTCDPKSFRCLDGQCIPFELTCDGIAHCADRSDEELVYCSNRNNCPENWFMCTNKKCISSVITCDGVDDCGDSSDEQGCTCTDDKHFQCKNGQCVLKTHRCDFDPDCSDRSDEMGCPPTNCTHRHGADFINCKYTTACIHTGWICDGADDCWDNSDEQNCPPTITCTENQFQCPNGTCIDEKLRCDGKNDCALEKGDVISADEQLCPPLPCNGTQFRCSWSAECIDAKYRCDGKNDCNEGMLRVTSDEHFCFNDTCAHDQFSCDYRCVPLSFRCNLVPDCIDGSDERDCLHVCNQNQFKCKNGDCIPKSWECDGNPDCSDETDETKHCNRTVCSHKEFRCNSTGKCIPLEWVCDGHADCSDLTDENKTVCGVFDCSETQFRCEDENCIPLIYYCDGDRDCHDGSDEFEGCYRTCPLGMFTCQNGHCIPELQKCNGRDDCGDNSDEPDDCEANKLNHCEVKNLFRCNNSVCINETLLCDGENNCGDFSDETGCNINECTASPSPCAQICVDKPVGYECQCNPGYIVHPQDKHVCKDVNECLLRPCSQICHNTIGSYLCRCAPNYILGHDGSCTANSSIPVSLILANRYYIREVDLLGHSYILAHNLTNAVALDYDWKEQCIYWSDVTQHFSSIVRTCNYTRNDTTAEVLHSVTLHNTDGLAVDWVGRNLYWCDKGSDTIEVSSLSGKFKRVLINKGLEEPRAIALDPKHGYLYWSDWGNKAHIGKAGMDGSEAKSIITKGMGWPNALTISVETNELFWADARGDYIAVANLDGQNIKMITSRDKNNRLQLHHVFAIDLWEDYIYWTDWETKSVERCNKYTGENCTTILSTVHRPMDIRVVHPFKQPEISTPCRTANCSALCLLTPKAPFYTCACPENYILGLDNRTCVANCTSAHFECKSSYKCIPFWWKCDNQDDCGDGSDEPEDCPTFHCMPGQYQCKNKKCIHPANLCNGKDDCEDMSDESECDRYTCMNTQFRCEGNANVTARCIPSKQRCNKQVDCPLGEDEKDCPPASCPPSQFKCANDKCIPSVWVCDRDNDCNDNSDEEQDCGNRTCGSQYFRCNSGRCIPNNWRCDGDPDCFDNEDEPPVCSQPEFHTCEPSYFKCNNNKCIPGRWRCDDENDCSDGSDEQNCAPRNCSESEFKCGDGKCIRGSMRCDREFQCDDKSDEANCDLKCKDNEFRCSNPQVCIYKEWKCDGENDCSDGSDEHNCSELCPDHGFKCENGLCINEEWHCDGQSDCDDGSDERDCASFRCPLDRFRCRDHTCIPKSAVCDGYNQCSDGADEEAQACREVGLCRHSEFTCKNGNCISKELVCDSLNDCGDNSDELHCNNKTCQWDSCSQICVQSKHDRVACKCMQGYIHKGDSGCEAEGSLAVLVLAAEAELRLISPYKQADLYLLKKTLATAPGYKVDAVDVLFGKRQVDAFWTDKPNKRVQSLGISIDAHGRTNRDADVAKTILSNLKAPHGISLDWIAKRLYITDDRRILVATLDGKTTFTLLDDNMQQLRDLVVAPIDGLLFWIDLGPKVRIETAHMDGDKRQVLLDTGLLWPTGLAIDFPQKRLYWADPKTKTVASVGFNGQDIHVVHVFNDDMRPYKLDVFEDHIYLSTYLKYDVLKLNKFGKGNITHLSQGSTRISDMLILQENKHIAGNNTCDNYCASSEFCLLTPGGAVCTCPDGFVKDGLSCTTSTKTECLLNCGPGKCKYVQDQGPQCDCPVQYNGTYCQNNICSEYCKNGGRCSVDNTTMQFTCTCPPQWTGDRCNTPVDMCRNRCYNGGICYFTSQPDFAACTCLPGFRGKRCQHCDNLSCENGGFCSKDTGTEKCICPKNYKGKYCESSICGKHGKIIVTPNSVRCSCLTGYTGERCEQNTCYQHCQNGGTCTVNAQQQPECLCPPFFAGPVCEIDLCQSKTNAPEGCKDRCSCQNNGVCKIVVGSPVCQCPDSWGGDKCQLYIGHSNRCSNYCDNEGICQILSPKEPPVCRCPAKWSGPRCQYPAVCNNYCQNDATCSVIEDMAYCQCTKQYSGVRCEKYIGAREEAEATQTESRSVFVPILIALVVIIVVLVIGFVMFEYVFKKRPTFSHERLQENDFNNPIYQDRDAEPFTLNADKSGNFANPVYESVYNGTTSGKDEKAVLLEHATDETPPPATEL